MFLQHRTVTFVTLSAGKRLGLRSIYPRFGTAWTFEKQVQIHTQKCKGSITYNIHAHANIKSCCLNSFQHHELITNGEMFISRIK